MIGWDHFFGRRRIGDSGRINVARQQGQRPDYRNISRRAAGTDSPGRKARFAEAIYFLRRRRLRRLKEMPTA